MTNEELRLIRRRFEHRHKKLYALNPLKVVIVERSRLDDEKQEWGPYYLCIEVWHSIIFDNRLIPEYFDGVAVSNITAGDRTYKKFFPNDGIGEPYFITEIEAPERYVRFVQKNFKLIRKKLKSPDMSEYEMLDALTGGFEKHIEQNEKMRKEWLERQRNRWKNKLTTVG